VTDGQPIATIIDFGIAKATERRHRKEIWRMRLDH
jgi:hypothetical protein